MHELDELEYWIINELAEWFSDGYEEFINSARIMYNAGISIDDIKEILADLHGAVSNEYGD